MIPMVASATTAPHEYASLCICFHERKDHTGPEMGSECRDELGHAIATYGWLLRRAYDSATIRAGDDIRCK